MYELMASLMCASKSELLGEFLKGLICVCNMQCNKILLI